MAIDVAATASLPTPSVARTFSRWIPRSERGTVQGFFAGLPLLVSVPSDLFGGIVTDRLTTRFGLRTGRCTLVIDPSRPVFAGFPEPAPERAA